MQLSNGIFYVDYLIHYEPFKTNQVFISPNFILCLECFH